MSDYFDVPKKLTILPTTRAAYSDHSAWMMNGMSALAYLPFKGRNQFKDILGTLSKLAKTARQLLLGLVLR